MKQFTDSKGDTWTVEVNGATIKRAQNLLQVDLGNPLEGDPPLIVRFDMDIVFKVDLLYAACLPQIEKRKLTDEQFAERLSGEVLQAASEALWASLLLFFQNLRRTEVVEVMHKQQALVAQAIERVAEVVKSVSMDEIVEAELAGLGDSLSSLRLLPDSIPSDPPSGN